MNHTRLRSRLKRDEGYSPTPYLDSKGNLTVGVGHLIHYMRLEALLPRAILGEAWDFLTDSSVHEHWFEQDVMKAEFAARQYLGDEAFNSLSEARQEVLTELAFQTGANGIKGFKRLREAILAHHWVQAEKELLDSEWHRHLESKGSKRSRDMASRFLEG